jgi:hypothetical protein
MTRSCVHDPRETMGTKPHRALPRRGAAMQPAWAGGARCQEDGSYAPAHARGASRLLNRRRAALAVTAAKQALDQHQRGGTTESHEPGADAKERGGRTHADERREDTTKHSPEDADQQSAHLRFAVGWNGIRDPARNNFPRSPKRRTPWRSPFDECRTRTPMAGSGSGRPPCSPAWAARPIRRESHVAVCVHPMPARRPTSAKGRRREAGHLANPDVTLDAGRRS